MAVMEVSGKGLRAEHPWHSPAWPYLARCPQQPSAGLDVALIEPGLDAAPHRGFTMAVGTLCGCSPNQSAPKGCNVDTAQRVLPERELPSGPGKQEKWNVVFF